MPPWLYTLVELWPILSGLTPLTAAKADADRDAKIREEAAKEARQKAATDAEAAARSAGASAETIARVKASILGLPS